MTGAQSQDLAARSAREVLEDHLRLASVPDGFEADLARNVAEDVVVLTGRGVFRGIPGIRELARQLMAEIPSGRWTYVNRLVEGRLAFLEWTVDDGPFRIRDGADSYLIEDGRIRMQTIHYTVEDPDGRVLIRADGTRPS
ncbi:nuclear transport factor 2 family protein [Blastococcus sp. TF02-09]|uniref:nuclear transport factor 2 family protein n=1 Tax=Blastococcus sp. TF02-09 TaxID=2250576 RepID=UPI000DEB663E|nr:nuclear transport factor 2 family protein [Blastococcus sp. TF02-9]RBY76929.1 nuclear transport factor 2 family protein [Blastococcus sp. TF02-9]